MPQLRLCGNAVAIACSGTPFTGIQPCTKESWGLLHMRTLLLRVTTSGGITPPNTNNLSPRSAAKSSMICRKMFSRHQSQQPRQPEKPCLAHCGPSRAISASTWGRSYSNMRVFGRSHMPGHVSRSHFAILLTLEVEPHSNYLL